MLPATTPNASVAMAPSPPISPLKLYTNSTNANVSEMAFSNRRTRFKILIQNNPAASANTMPIPKDFSTSAASIPADTVPPRDAADKSANANTMEYTPVKLASRNRMVLVVLAIFSLASIGVMMAVELSATMEPIISA